eukprot:m.72462 g.72462  ORF g.72462 m.72462 type:complete len:449 (-) comp10116_c0_seq1:1365-2711(-)
MADGDWVETHATESTEMEHVRYAAPYTSPSRGSPPRKAPYTDVDATSISMRTLNKTPQGRQSTFETRMAMQRELDTSRSQLAASRDAADGLRRDALSSKEEAAHYRSENIQLSDALRSCKQRLNNALDAQDDILRKNTEKHAQIHELQNREATLRDELASKTGLADFYQEQNQQLEKELADALANLTTTKTQLSTELTTTLETLERCHHELKHHRSGHESEAALNGELKAQLRAAATEREEVKHELMNSIGRLESVQAAQNELRAQITIKDDIIAARDTEISTLSLRLNEKDERLTRLETELCELRVAADDAALLRASTNHLADQLAARECAARDAAAVHFETDASRFAIDKARMRVEAEARTRAIEAELAASRANAELSASRAARMVSRPRSALRPMSSRVCCDGARDADLEAARALRSYHAVRAGRPLTGGTTTYRYERTSSRRRF